jgi:lipoyl(octanoyl) transferase
VYALVDLARRGLTVRAMVTAMEQAVIDTLAAHDVNAERRSGAPGVYVNGAKIAALGLRVRRGCCYHGVALNVSMDLAPFSAIDPCGYPGLAVTQTSALGIAAGTEQIGRALAERISRLIER